MIPNKKKFQILISSLLISIGLVIIILFIIVSGNQKNITPQSSPNTQVAKKLLVNKDKKFTIDLEANPSTGYRWEAKYDENFLKLEKTSFENYPSDNERVGAPLKQLFEFSPLKSGATEIIFKYVRPWEQESKPEDIKIFSIIIN